ncbi:MAG: hypothetical protein ACOVNQ_08425 [Pirellula sp.]|jgi:hypothetical protein
MLWIVIDLAGLAIGQSSTGSVDQFQTSAPVMTFLDMYTGQPWGRYVVSETVTVPKYEYREVKDKVWVPTWVQEPKQTTTTQYDQIVSYQLRPRSVPSANPFSPPQQIVEYVPIVQYQPRNVQTTQMTAYQKYEEREVSRMVPVLVNASEQRQRFVDRPLSASGTPGVATSNLIQDSAMLAQANRTTARYPTRSIDYPTQPTYGSPVYGYTSSNATWNTPVVMAPPPPMSPPQYSARQAAIAPIVPIVSQTAVPSSPPVYAGTGTPIPPPSGVPTMPFAYPAAPAGQPSYGYNGYPQQGYPQQGYPQPSFASNPSPPYPYAINPYAANPYPPNPYANNPNPPNPYVGNPYAANPYAANPYAANPYAANPYAANPYAAWYARQGTLFPTTLFGTTGGQASMVSGGYPYTGYPPGAVPPSTSTYGYPSTGYGAPRMANNPLGVSSNAPNYLGRTTLPFPSGSY